ncbi:heptaprenyl diphosphate synthase component II [Insulibacter thermoxylanivorax]|uniref:Heptaprenyl diphosphate synthase component II n=2 Tax=Insulibacter thermoxylanivorax TaxID=2749268 RepID=A0A916QA89_9BACL|nr:heptaprenyl diphosphate synthase component II [Insulibacter thermoxylanivorax]
MKLHERLDIPLSVIDEAMADVILSDPDLPSSSIIRDSVLRLIASGGKRLRPMLVIIGGRFGRKTKESKLLRTAVLMEYLHMASLVHDDIIDGARMRRGEIALHRRTGVYTAALIADYMIARALEWTQTAYDEDSEDEQRLSHELAALASQLCLGEYRQMRCAFDFDITLRLYVAKTRQKTAMLMASCLKAGAEAAQADERTAELLYRIGDALGMAFQIQDDILDFVQSDEALGKPAGADLRNGNITLPVLLALQDPELGDAIRRLHPQSLQKEFDEVISAIAASPAIEKAMRIRDRYTEYAERLLRKLHHFPAHEDLTVMLHALSNRSA